MQLPTNPIEMSYDYREVVMWLRKCGRKHLGKNFIIPENEKGIIFGMLAWFLQDELVAKEMNIDLRKGIMLSGPIGCGKTTLFKLMGKIPSERKNFMMTSTAKLFQNLCSLATKY